MPDQLHPVRIALADDHPIFRDGLRRLLESEPGFVVVAEASDGEAALNIGRTVQPDVLLLDVAMPQMSGLDVLSALPPSDSKIILLTAAIESADILKAVQLGAHGVVLKESATRSLIEGIYRVLDGKFIIGTDVADDLIGALRRVEGSTEEKFGLTSRELDVVAAVVEGATNRDIATALGISQQTVKHHLTNIFDKTGASSRLELALLALKRGVVDNN